jgi:hypothetical protein
LLNCLRQFRGKWGGGAEQRLNVSEVVAIDTGVLRERDGDRWHDVCERYRPVLCMRFATTLRWVNITPFGRPVVPEE